MPVVLFHHAGIGVPELLGDKHEGNPPVDQRRGIGMPEFMEGEGFQSGRGIGLPYGAMSIILHPTVKCRCLSLKDNLGCLFKF